jgi:hypothetical protein
MTGPPLPVSRGHAPARRELSGLDGAHRSDGRGPPQSDGAKKAFTAETLEAGPDGKPCKAAEKRRCRPPDGRSAAMSVPIRTRNGRVLERSVRRRSRGSNRPCGARRSPTRTRLGTHRPGGRRDQRDRGPTAPAIAETNATGDPPPRRSPRPTRPGTHRPGGRRDQRDRRPSARRSPRRRRRRPPRPGRRRGPWASGPARARDLP